METTILVISLIISLLTLGAIFFLVSMLKKGNLSSDSDGAEDIKKALESESRSIKDTYTAGTRSSTETLAKWLEQTNKDLSTSLSSLQDNNVKSMKAIQDELNEKLKEIREGNQAQLDKMREVVDNKLTETVNKKFDESFATVEKQIVNLLTSIGEMNKLTEGITDLNKLLVGTKTKGNWGEESLEMILEDILTADQYEKQSKCGDKLKSGAVDFAIRFPGKNDGEIVYLPIDSKFPTSSYTELLNARAEYDKDKIKDNRAELAKDVKKMAKDIQTKYINPPNTTTFAIMFLPSEGLYSEVMSIPNLVQSIQTDYSVIIAGPSSISVMLHSFRIGFKTIQVQKYSVEILKALEDFRIEFTKFADDATKSKKQVENLSDTIGSTYKRMEKIQRKLSGLKSLSDGVEAEIAKEPGD
ncbi:MAG TPA: DNA recombination protein RmuC [Clostridia bacterium]|jgi:DNA recombination protein RmuC|nr:DNA recombination protein RmuC [Clostridia bacterium]